MVFLAIERFIIVYFPLRAKVLCPHKKAVIAAITLPAVMCAVFAYHAVAWEIDENGTCYIKARFQFLMTKVCTPAYSSFLPVAVKLFNAK